MRDTEVDHVGVTWVHSCEVFGSLLYSLCCPAVQNLRVGWQACRWDTRHLVYTGGCCSTDCFAACLTRWYWDYLYAPAAV